MSNRNVSLLDQTQIVGSGKSIASQGLEAVAERDTNGVTHTIGERSSILAVGHPRHELRTAEKVDEHDTDNLARSITPERFQTSQGKVHTQMGDLSDKIAMRTGPGAFGTRDSEDLDDKFEVFVIGVDESTT